MKISHYSFLAAAIYLAPHLYPLVAAVLAFVCFALGVFAAKKGD